ncbi:hypothetical protein BDF20DRAFT_892279 [Mycotypha africana]|uniref:uncharacterized protein n=1 Tax=Mycotypha africana TaxID=64632 RepID=UPI002301CD39|nr:uncharacterized protein BDF20DRAFT_892279 [Mycotypha africana]KAI8968920.1 hypothetical protein BDF20DRAFT_892279 [Mycotypha africana]
MQSSLGETEPAISQKEVVASARSSFSILTSIRQIFTLTPKYATRQIIIRQKPDKKEIDTIFSVQGVCTTTETSYIPKQLQSAITTTWSFEKHSSKVHHFEYSLDITFRDRQEKFTLLPRNKWDKDELVHVCHDRNCELKFSWRQRKHHCRRCGHIFCNWHSGNRLPLFTSSASAERPCFTRVCDGCFFTLAQHSIVGPSISARISA